METPRLETSKLESLTAFAQEEYGKVRSWKAYGHGILVWKEGELHAYSIDGKKNLLVPSAREDAANIGRDWSYHPYSRGAIFYEWSRRLGHEGMEIDKRIEITAYSDEGKRIKLYDTGDQYILPPLEWAPGLSGIVVAKKEENWSKEPEKKEEKIFVLYSVDGHQKQLYRGWCDEWKPYGRGIILRQGHDYLACAAEIGHENPTKLVEFKGVEYWTGYGKGLIIGAGWDLVAFRDGFSNYYSQLIVRQGWEKKAQPHLPALPCFQPSLDGIVMEQEKKLVLFRDHADRGYPVAQEVLYTGEWKRWEVYNNLLVIEQLRHEEKKTIQSWSALTIKDSVSIALDGLERALRQPDRNKGEVLP